MALPSSNVVQANGSLDKTAPSADGIACIVLGGVAPAGAEFALGDELVVYELAEAEALGITADYDTTNEVVVYEHIKDFYSEAGPGAELHIMVVAQATTMADMLDKANAYVAKVLAANKGKIKLVAVAANPDVAYTPVVTDGLDEDVWNAAAKAMELRAYEFDRYRYCSFIIEGRGFAGNASTAKDLRDPVDGLNANRVHICLQAHPDVYGRGGQVAKYAAVGLLLGRAAAIPVQRSVGRVRSGAVSWDAAGMSSGTDLGTFSETNLDVLNNKGYIFLRELVGKAGFFFNDDHAACPITDDYSGLAAGRTMDKASAITRAVYLEEVNEEIELDPDTGRMMPSVIKGYQAECENAINAQMKGEISGVSVKVDPLQDVLNSENINTEVRLVQKGKSKTITSTLKFVTSLNA